MLIVGGLIDGLAKLLNATAFKTSPARSWIAWSLTIVAWIASFIALFIGSVLAYKSIAADLGVPSLASSGPKPNFFLPFLFAWLFFMSLNRKQKGSVKAPAPASGNGSAAPSLQQEPIAPTPQPSTVGNSSSTVANRLKELQVASEMGYVTKSEYEQKRKAIIDQI